MVHQYLAGPGAGHDAVLTQKDSLHRGDIGQAGEDDVRFAHDLVGGLGRVGARPGDLAHLALTTVVDRQVEAGREQAIRHGQAHPAQADKADL